MTMIGGDKATVHVYGKNPMVSIVVPRSFLRELEENGQKLENGDVVRLWVERTGMKCVPKPWAFRRKIVEGLSN